MFPPYTFFFTISFFSPLFVPAAFSIVINFFSIVFTLPTFPTSRCCQEAPSGRTPKITAVACHAGGPASGSSKSRRSRQAILNSRVSPLKCRCSSQPFAECTNNFLCRLTPDLAQECERIINKVLPACVAFHKPGFLQKLKSGNLETSIVNALLTIGAR